MCIFNGQLALVLTSNPPAPVPSKRHQLQLDGKLWHTLVDLSQGKLSGELIVRYGEHAARVHLVQGEIAWVQLSPRRIPLAQILNRGVINLDGEALTAVLEECQYERAHFVDVLVAWGLALEEDIREALRLFFVEQLGDLLEHRSTTSLFVPSPPQHARLSFSLSELVEVQRTASGVYLSALGLSDAELEEHLCRVERMPGVLGLTLLNQLTQELVKFRGEQPEPGLQGAILGLLRVASEPGTHVLLGTERCGAAALALSETYALLLLFDLRNITQGRALQLLRDLREAATCSR